MCSLVKGLSPPLGLDPKWHGKLGVVTATAASRYIFQMDLRVHQGVGDDEPEAYVLFSEVLAGLIKDMPMDTLGSGSGSRDEGFFKAKAAAAYSWDRFTPVRRSRHWKDVLPSGKTPVGRRWLLAMRDKV